MLRGAKRRGNPYLIRQEPAKSAEFVRFRNGLPRQCAHWLAMTDFSTASPPGKNRAAPQHNRTLCTASRGNEVWGTSAVPWAGFFAKTRRPGTAILSVWQAAAAKYRERAPCLGLDFFAKTRRPGTAVLCVRQAGATKYWQKRHPRGLRHGGAPCYIHPSAAS